MQRSPSSENARGTSFPRSSTSTLRVRNGHQQPVALADTSDKISKPFLTPRFPRFGMKRSSSPLTRMRDVVPSRHGDGCGCYRSTLDVVTYPRQISRSLLVRNHPQALPFVNRLFELFDDLEVGWDASRAIGQVGTADKVLTKRNHAVIKVVFLRVSYRH
jgi:RNAPII transcription regulator C-terminal